MTRIARVLGCFAELGFRFDVAQFESRLVAQKLVYLLQELGVDLEYRDYNFYLRGTYSPRLTRDLFALADGKSQEKVALSAKDRARIRRLRDIGELRPHVLEAMAAYRFLRTHGRSTDEALREIKTRKPFLSERDIAIGVSRCKGIFPEVTESDHRYIEAETARWDEASAEDEL